MDPIIARMQEDLKDLGRSLHTRRVYVQSVTRLRRHVARPLDEVELEDVRKYMRDLIRRAPRLHESSTISVWRRSHASFGGLGRRPSCGMTCSTTFRTTTDADLASNPMRGCRRAMA